MTLDLMKLVPPAPTREPDRAAPPIRKGLGDGGAVIAEEFKDILEEKIGDLVAVTQESSRLDRDFAAGKTDNIHEVMVSAAKAGLAVETALQIRNLAIGAYQKLTQLR